MKKTYTHRHWYFSFSFPHLFKERQSYEERKKETEIQRYRKMNRDTARLRDRDRKTEKHYTTQASLKLATQLSFPIVWIAGMCSTTSCCLVS